MCEPVPLVRPEGTASGLLDWTGDDQEGDEPRLGPVACCYTFTPTRASPLIPTDPPTVLVCQLGFQPLAAKCLSSGPSSAWPPAPSSSHLHTCLWALSLTPPPPVDHAHHSPLLCLASSERPWSPSAQHSPDAHDLCPSTPC